MHLKYDLYESKILEPQKYLTVKLSETLITAQKGDIGSHSIFMADLRDRVVQRKEICKEEKFSNLVFI